MTRRDSEKHLLGNSDQSWVSDNGASQQIEDNDNFDPLDADEDPFLVNVVDDDGYPGLRPFAHASNDFEKGNIDPIDEEGEVGDDEDDLNARMEAADSDQVPDSEVLGDEFVAKIQTRDDAAVDHGGRPVSDLAMLSAVHAADQANSEEDAKTVRINPLSAYDALLGGQAALAPGDAPVEVARWTAESQIESCPVTVGFGQANPGGQGGTSLALVNHPPARPYIIVQYGTRNASLYLEVDIGEGGQFTIGATAVNVQVAQDVDPVAVGTPLQILLAAQLSFYPTVRTTPVTRTKYVDTFMGFGFQATVVVPPFAKRVGIYRIGTTTVDTYVFRDSNRTAVFTASMATTVSSLAPILLPPDIRTIDASTGDLSDLSNMRFVFELCL